jgi:hypothetical protein
MLYSLLVLTFGIYLGQEYPIPSIKNNVLLLYTIYNKKNELREEKKEEVVFVYKPGYSDKLLEMLRKYIA